MLKPVLNQTPRSSFQVLRDVTFGLLIRELKTRFGSYRLGYAWALLDPLLMIGLFSAIFGMRGHSG
ncbi:ABC transporter, partial [Escherichia coli]|nr:ABC transporter [Escherichia coli]